MKFIQWDAPCTLAGHQNIKFLFLERYKEGGFGLGVPWWVLITVGSKYIIQSTRSSRYQGGQISHKMWGLNLGIRYVGSNNESNVDGKKLS